MKQSLVSIIIPCYNAEKYIDRAICSVFDEDWNSIELIVVNDGSSDTSKDHILAWKPRFEEKGLILKYIEQPNRGLGGAIDTGLKSVTGDYLMLLDADDRFLNGAIKEKAQFLEEHSEYALVRSNGWVVSGEDRWFFVYEEYEKQENLFEMLLSGRTNNWAGSYMIRTKLLFDFYPDRCIFPSRFGQNLQLLLPVSLNRKCGFIDKPQMEYIKQDSSLSKDKDQELHKIKALENADGHNSIRLHMIEILPLSMEEQTRLKKKSNAMMWRAIMEIGIENKDIVLVEKSMKELKKNSGTDINDLINYYSYFENPIIIILKAYRRIITMVNKHIKCISLT